MRSAGDRLAFLPQPRIADQHHVGELRRLRLREQARDQLGADAGGVAQRQRDDGFACVSMLNPA